MEIYRLAIVIVIVCIIIYVIYAFMKTSKKVAVTLTSPRNTKDSYTVLKSTISKINNDISTSNYAISIWQYIDAWSDTNKLKSIINIPDVLQLSLGETTNDLSIKMYGNPRGSSSPSMDSSSQITNDTSRSHSSTDNITDARNLFGLNNIFGYSSGTPTPSVNTMGIEGNNVYQYNTNTYVFSYYTYENVSSQTKWNSVRVIYSNTDPSIPLTGDTLYWGGTVNSLLLEENGQIPPNGINQPFSSCPKWNWSCTPRPKSEACDKGTNIDICEPSISKPLKTPYTIYQSGGRQITTAIYTITTRKGQPYFLDKQKFRFLYYSTNSPKSFMPIPASMSDTVTVLPYPSSTIETLVGINELYLNTEPSALPTKTSLLDLSENHLISEEATIQESLVGSTPVDVTYKITNMPMQTWTNIIININGVNITVYINGQIRSAYILPFVPNQMNDAIQLTPAPSFTGWTSNLRYIPYGVSAGEAQQIYSEGYMGKSFTPGWYSFFKRYSLKVIFVDNLGK